MHKEDGQWKLGPELDRETVMEAFMEQLDAGQSIYGLVLPEEIEGNYSVYPFTRVDENGVQEEGVQFSFQTLTSLRSRMR